MRGRSEALDDHGFPQSPRETQVSLALHAKTSTEKPGPKGPSRDLIAAIVEMKRRNPKFGCRRIAQQISFTFGVDIDKDVVRRVLAWHYHPEPGSGGPSWLTFIGHTKDSQWSVDLFRCESVFLKSHWVMVVLDQFTRRIVGFAVQSRSLDGAADCRMFNEVLAGKEILPLHLISDHDPLLEFRQWQANLRVLEVTEVKTVPHVPLLHPFVERLIGTVRRELLDQVLFWTATDLERKLLRFQAYYNRARVHASLDGITPDAKAANRGRTNAKLNDYRWESHCRGLYQLPAAA